MTDEELKQSGQQVCVNFNEEKGHPAQVASFYCMKEKVFLCEICYEEH